MRRSNRKHKHFVLDEKKIKRAQKLIGARTATETIETALDELISERQRNLLAWRANQRFMRSGITIRDVYGKLED